MKGNYEYKKINTKIGEIRLRQAFALKNAGCYALCGTLIGTCLVQNPTAATSTVFGADLLLVSYYGVRSYLYQRQINNLKEDKGKIKCKSYTH